MGAAYLKAPAPTVGDFQQGDPGCFGKVRFAEARLAHAVASKTLLARDMGNGKKQRGIRESYRCDTCGGWHVGSRGRSAAWQG